MNIAKLLFAKVRSTESLFHDINKLRKSNELAGMIAGVDTMYTQMTDRPTTTATTKTKTNRTEVRGASTIVNSNNKDDLLNLRSC
jgi:hypothetical protein